jgi:hypothetical protein
MLAANWWQSVNHMVPTGLKKGRRGWRGDAFSFDLKKKKKNDLNASIPVYAPSRCLFVDFII